MFQKISSWRLQRVARRRVARGIAWLENRDGTDQQLIGRYSGGSGGLNIDMINPATVDIGNTILCALAQATGVHYNMLTWTDGFRASGLSFGWLKRHGFHDGHKLRVQRALNKEWRRQLTDRRVKNMAQIQTYVQTQFAEDVKAFVELAAGLRRR